MTPQRRALAWTAGLLAMLAYLPALTAAPGRMPADSKLYLYLDPGGLIGDAAKSFDPKQFAGWVPHQHVSFLWPSGPWFWIFDTFGVPDWVAHRLWIGTLMIAAGLGVRWCGRLLGLTPWAAAVAGVVYQTSLYILPYVSRTSVMLLPWAGLGWIVAFTIRGTRRTQGGRSMPWADPAAIALIVFTVGSVNATALAMITPAPVLWLIHWVWQRWSNWPQALAFAARTAGLSVLVSAWWVAMSIVQVRNGTDVLPYSESLADVSLTASAPEIWRGLGYWLFYVRDPAAPATTESLRYLSSSPAIVVSYLVPIACVAGLVVVRWANRRFAALLVVAGALLAVGVHPLDDRSPLAELIGGEGGLALALRSSTRALPVMTLGLALAAGSLVSAVRASTRLPSTIGRFRLGSEHVAGAAIGLLAIVNLPALWSGGLVDNALERDQHPPTAWTDAVASMPGNESRVLQIPGAEFGAYRWGSTVDQPLPGLTDKPVITRDLLPLGSPAAMDLLYAFDDRIQDGVFEPESIAPISRLLGVDSIWLTNDAAFERFQTARPEIVRDIVNGAPGIASPTSFGGPGLNAPSVPMTDKRALADPRIGQPTASVDVFPVDGTPRIIRATAGETIVSGSGDGLVDLAAAGLLPEDSVIRYSGSLDSDELTTSLGRATLLVTDSNRDRARHWRSSQDTTGFTETGGPEQGVLTEVASDERLPLFGDEVATSQTVALQVGPIRATATAYGEPFAYLPEHRPYMAIDGDAETAWLVGEHGNPIGEVLRLDFDAPVAELVVRQPSDPGTRRITGVQLEIRQQSSAFPMAVQLDNRSLGVDGQPIHLPIDLDSVEIRITNVGGGTPFTASAVAGVGFAEITTRKPEGISPTIEVVRPPHDALTLARPHTPIALAFTRLRTDPMDRWRDDPESSIVREFELPAAYSVEATAAVRIDARASDAELAALFDWPVTASSRLTGSLRNPGVAAFDGDDSTSWITAFGEAIGASLTIDDVSEPVSEITVRQPFGGFSAITSLTVRSDDSVRTVRLEPNASGAATAAIDPPLPAGRIVVEISTIEPRITVDRRFGDPFQLPAAISELRIDGAPAVTPLDQTSLRIDCVPIFTIDGEPTRATLSITDSEWLDGGPIQSETCGLPSVLSSGNHLLIAIDSGLSLTVDRVVLDSRGELAGTESADAAPPSVAVLDSSAFGREVEVSGCGAGCWLVVGEGFNTAWSASVAGASLGQPELVDGGFNGWWINPRDEPVVVDVRWTAQTWLNVAFAISALAIIGAAALVVHDRRRRPNESEASHRAPTFERLNARISTRSALMRVVALVVLPAALIGPLWGFWGFLGGVPLFLLRRGRVGELTALCSLTATGVLVVFIERRDAPFPNGGWTTTFDSLHGLGMFAIVSLLVGALFANDARDRVTDE